MLFCLDVVHDRGPIEWTHAHTHTSSTYGVRAFVAALGAASGFFIASGVAGGHGRTPCVRLKRNKTSLICPRPKYIA